MIRRNPRRRRLMRSTSTDSPPRVNSQEASMISTVSQCKNPGGKNRAQLLTNAYAASTVGRSSQPEGTKTMRLSGVACVAAVVLSVSASAFAQEYVEYKSMQDRFGATFPTEPRVTASMFKSQFGSMLPMRTYESDSGNSHFKV